MTKTTFGYLAGLAAAISIAASLPAMSDPANTTMTTTTTVTTTTTDTPYIDYRALVNPTITQMDIKWAHANGLSDNDLAAVYAIADKTGQTGSAVLERVINGETFLALAAEYGLSPSVVTRTDEYKTRLANLEMAYNTTGYSAMRHHKEFHVNMGSMDNDTTVVSSSTTTASIASSDVLGTMRAQGDFRTFLHAIRRADLENDLRASGPITVFAPTDAAFDKLSKDQVKDLFRDKDRLRSVIELHVIPARVTAADAMAMTSPTSPATLNGQTLQVTTTNGTVMLNGVATVTQPDIQASNGVIHGIDTVLMPAK
jgi:uncharacterized surface protein with fasciclin (FAS1) repeats